MTNEKGEMPPMPSVFVLNLFCHAKSSGTYVHFWLYIYDRPSRAVIGMTFIVAWAVFRIVSTGVRIYYRYCAHLYSDTRCNCRPQRYADVLHDNG